MSKKRVLLGKWGESLAADYLADKDYEIIERNARTPYGEIDLVVRQTSPAGDVTVFVEVKTRSSTAFGFPEEGVTEKKRSHILAAAQAYLQERPDLDGDWRIDIIAIQVSGNEQVSDLMHFENAVH